MSENDRRWHGIVETIKNARARGQSDFVIRNPPKPMIERLRAEGHTVENDTRPGRVLVKLAPVIEAEPEEPDTP